MNANSIYDKVTERIIEQLSKNIVPWQKPWFGGSNESDWAISYTTRKPYSMLNQMLLCKPGEWLTFNQIKQLGGSIKKGAKSGIIVWYQASVVEKKKLENEDGEEEEFISIKSHPVFKCFNVFHIDDCVGIESKTNTSTIVPDATLNPLEEAENVIGLYLANEPKLIFQNDKQSNDAYYNKAQDLVVVPMLSQYANVAEYYSTAFHELVHSTMIESRCNRVSEKERTNLGDSSYSLEELVAEIGSAMLCNKSGIDNEQAFNNSASYVAEWLKKLKSDNKLIYRAATRAEKAVKYILGENK